MLELTPYLNSLAQGQQGEFPIADLIAIALVPITLATFIFFFGTKLQYSGKPVWLKWIAFVPLAVGLILGIAPTQKFYGDPLYKEFYGGGMKKGLLHAGGVILPIFGAVGFVIWNKWLTRQKFEDL